MRYRSHRQPLCRCCGNPIRKHTETVQPKEVLKNKADCQRVSNYQVVSVSYRDVWSDDPDTGERVRSRGTVFCFTTWDGITYEDEFFCTGSCAQRFGRFAAKHADVCTVAYVDALREQEAKLK